MRAGISVLALLLVGCGAARATEAETVELPAGSPQPVETVAEPTESPPAPALGQRARQHLPLGCDLVLVTEGAALDEPSLIRQRFLEALVTGLSQQGHSMAAVSRFVSQVGSPSRLSIVGCIDDAGSDDPSVLFTIDGEVPIERLNEAFRELADGSASFEQRRIDGRKVFADHDDSLFWTQAEDGTLLVSNRGALLVSAFDASRAFDTYELPTSGDVLLLADAAGARHLAGEEPANTATATTERIEAQYSSEEGTASAVVTMSDEKGAEALAEKMKPLLAVTGPLGTAQAESLEVRVEESRVFVSARVTDQLVADFVGGWLREAAKGW